MCWLRQERWFSPARMSAAIQVIFANFSDGMRPYEPGLRISPGQAYVISKRFGGEIFWDGMSPHLRHGFPGWEK
jgi:hypothetical protein